MVSIIDKYVDSLTDIVFMKINNALSNQQNYDLIKKHFNDNIDNEKNTREHFKMFQEYYFKILDNKNEYLSSEFFFKFRQKYSIQGVDTDFLKHLELNKQEIINLIESNDLSNLYFRFFNCVKIKHGESTIEKNFGSFFTKLVHTFKSQEYSPLDIPIKNFFGLENESYFISLIVISKAFSKWSNENKERIGELRLLLIDSIKINLKEINNDNLELKISDMKILNLIFWSIAQSSK